MIYFLLYLVIINAAGFLLMRTDKKKARRRQRRIPERMLLGTAVIGGSIGTLIAMYTYHHKTKHRRFKFGIPAILFVQADILILVLCSG